MMSKTGIDRLDGALAFWKEHGENFEQAVTEAFFLGVAEGIEMGRSKTTTEPPVIRQRAAPGSKMTKDVDRSPDLTVRR